MLVRKLSGMGDSNLTFGGVGWAGGFEALGLYEGDVINIPGGSTEDALWVINVMLANAPSTKGPVLVTFGINDMLQGIGPIRFCRNHLKLKREYERVLGPREWVWMPSHYTGQWKLEVLRYALRITAWWHGIKFVTLRDYKDMMKHYYRSPEDHYHLTPEGYETLAFYAATQITDTGKGRLK